MKNFRFASILALFLLGFAATHVTSAQTGEQSASGSYQFLLEDGFTKYIEFDARKQGDGSATGRMFFSDESVITDQDVDGTGDPQETHRGFYLSAEFDGLVVTGNRAVMSGTIRDASITRLIGRRVLLTVEDNGDNTREPDRLTWGVYKPAERGWTPSDAELESDPGVGMRWRATDAERRDDVGVEMPRSEAIGIESFPVASYAFVEVERGAGDIRVQP